jgi:hypothetical protein
MTIETIFAVFEDFNEQRQEPDEAVVEVQVVAPEQVRDETWTDGYLAGRQERGTQNDDLNTAAKLMTSVSELQEKAAEAIEAASLAVADLLVNTVIALTADDWSAKLMDRVRLIAERIKPALTVAPEFILRDDQGTLHSFDDISKLARALEAGSVGEDVSIRWQRGEATISRSALLKDLRQAIVPLSAGRSDTHLVTEQNARHPT